MKREDRQQHPWSLVRTLAASRFGCRVWEGEKNDCGSLLCAVALRRPPPALHSHVHGWRRHFADLSDAEPHIGRRLRCSRRAQGRVRFSPFLSAFFRWYASSIFLSAFCQFPAPGLRLRLSVSFRFQKLELDLSGSGKLGSLSEE